MRVVVHDYAGHPFPAQLARGLASRDHDVLHLQCASFVAGKGRVEREPEDPPGLTFECVVLREEFAKYALHRRIEDELRIGRDLSRRIEAFRPDAVLSNAPLIVQGRLLRASHALGAGFVFWQQDVFAAAARRVLGRRSRFAGAAAGLAVGMLERRLLRRSDGVVAISEDFLSLLRRWGVEESRVSVIENWAPLAELPALSRDNAWAREHGLVDCPVFLYSGTLGFKHDPSLLLELARWARGRGAVVVVVSEGPGADWLAQRGREEPALRLLPYQRYARLPEVLASADVLLAVLEPEAGAFSVPSKVLTYLCAERPLLVAVPANNLAARVVERSQAGLVIPTGDPAALVDAADALLEDEEHRIELGRNARIYAEFAFDVDEIALNFERVLARSCS